MRFEENFWSGNEPLHGVQVLHNKVAQGQIEHNQVLVMAQELASAHSQFEASINSIFDSNSWHRLDQAGFAKDDGASLKRAFYQLRDEYKCIAKEHRNMGDALQEKVVDSLKLWSEETKKIYKAKKMDAENAQKALNKARSDVEKKRQKYMDSWKHVEDLRENYPVDSKDEVMDEKLKNANNSSDNFGQMEILIQMGNCSISQQELKLIVNKMQSSIVLKEFKYPLLGTYRCITGEDLFFFLQSNYPQLIKSSEDAIAFGQALMDNGIIKLIGRGTKFVAKDTWFYQWSKSASEQHADKILDAEIALDEADRNYRLEVENAEKERLIFERTITEYLSFLQNMELTRISTLKQSLSTVAQSVTALTAASQNFCNTMLISLETVNPELDVDFLCENNKTGFFRPFPILYKNASDSLAKEQIFGVDLSEYCAYFKVNTPWLIEHCNRVIAGVMEDYDVNNKLATWLLAIEVKVDELYLARSLFNKSYPISVEMIREKFGHKPQLILALIRRYMMELPISLIPSDEYDTFKSLYLSKPEHSDVKNRLQSVKDVITNLPKYHYLTLKRFLRPLKDLIDEDSTLFGPGSPNSITNSWKSTPFHQILSYWGPIILRPAQISSSASLDRHPDRLLKDLILYYDEIFNDASFPPPAGIQLSPDNQQSAMIVERTPVLQALTVQTGLNNSVPSLEPQKLSPDAKIVADFDNVSLDNKSPKDQKRLTVKVPPPNPSESSTDSPGLSASSSPKTPLNPRPFLRKSSLHTALDQNHSSESETEAVEIYDDHIVEIGAEIEYLESEPESEGSLLNKRKGVLIDPNVWEVKKEEKLEVNDANNDQPYLQTEEKADDFEEELAEVDI